MSNVYLQIQHILYWLTDGYTLVITYLLEREFQEYVTCGMSRDTGCDLYFRYWIHNYKYRKRKSKIRSTILILSHLDVQNHSRLSKKKLLFKKRKLTNVSGQSLERKLKTQVILSTLAKLSMTNLSRLHYKLKHKPHRLLPFLISDFQWAH